MHKNGSLVQFGIENKQNMSPTILFCHCKYDVSWNERIKLKREHTPDVLRNVSELAWSVNNFMNSYIWASRKIDYGVGQTGEFGKWCSSW